ncbi:alpha/beta hydrolase [Pararhizobium sp.]|uniref:alpha/beta hydrolase n=1 Tax=Pararhizobium sp. TaxID=1977563 RepID=UPI00271C3B4F|nr:alpha/beta hydrolase [Pararhizobium sp.]MDO9415195.1 alpha/beta hydrolase [Pararhizobium sp.]
MTPILRSTPGNAVPDNHKAGYFDGVGGVQIRYAIFRSDAPVSKGTIVLLQGRNETIEKYYETIRDFNTRGLWVATFDWRGQGGSGRMLKNTRRGHVRHFSDYEHDLTTFLEHIVLPDTRLPFFMVAHSMGALIALSQAPWLENRIERIVVAAPFVELGAQAVSSGLIGIIARAARILGLGAFPLIRDRPPRPFEDNLLTADGLRYARNLAITRSNPDLGLGPPTSSWLCETLTAINRIRQREYLTQIQIPTLLLAPGRDTLVPHRAVERLARNFRAATMIPIDGARHELFQEADKYRAQAMAAIAAFIPGGDDAADDNPAA